ncbi:MAG: hypothetical protein RMJ54_19535, partial [Roseiflexaceae bacterium]|nr:hypothetical protein [Roseiflexaceae bacterium]
MQAIGLGTVTNHQRHFAGQFAGSLRIEQRLQVAAAAAQQHRNAWHNLLLTNIAAEVLALEADLVNG